MNEERRCPGPVILLLTVALLVTLSVHARAADSSNVPALQSSSAPADLSGSSESVPYNGETTSCALSELRWREVAGAVSYDLYIDGVHAATTSQSHWQLSSQLAAGRHFWSVDTRLDSNGITAGPLWQFDLLDAPSSPMPADGTTLREAVTRLGWTDACGAVSYEVHLNDTYLGTTSGTHIDLDVPLEPGPHVWRVRSLGDGGVVDGPSWRFVIDDASLSFSPQSFRKTILPGQNAPSDILEVWVSGGSASAPYTLSADAGWLGVSPASGSSSGERRQHTITYQTSGLANGVYEAHLTMASPGFPSKQIPVTLSVWTETPVCTAFQDQAHPVVCGDGEGGTIVAWVDFRAGLANENIYARRVRGDGIALWDTDGVPVCTAPGDQNGVRIVSDGSGGAILAWIDNRLGSGDLYAQRINADGHVEWASNGIPISGSVNFSYDLIADGNGGAIVAWSDTRSSSLDIYAQRINGQGSLLWTQGGVPVCTSAPGQDVPRLQNDGSGGAFVGWIDGNYEGISLQHLGSDGVPSWTGSGVSVVSQRIRSVEPSFQLVSDGEGGVLVAWCDQRNGIAETDIRGQRISPAGGLLWHTDGILVSGWSSQQQFPRMVSDGTGGAIVSWMDTRGYDGGGLYAQRIRANGTAYWTQHGVPVALSSGPADFYDVMDHQLVADGNGAAIMIWVDYRNGGTANLDLYAQRLNSSGLADWGEGGVAVMRAQGTQRAPALLQRPQGGAMAVWQDARNSNVTDSDIYAAPVGPLVTAPILSLSPTALSRSSAQGQNRPPDTFQVWNSGDSGVLAYTVADDAGWLSVSPVSGTSSGSRQSHTVTYNTSNLPPGTHRATITVSAPAAASPSTTISVTMTITACQYGVSPSSSVFGSGGGSGSFLLTAGPGCPWSTTSSTSWIVVHTSAGTGGGTVSYSVHSNTGPQRTGTISVSGITHSIHQEAPIPALTRHRAEQELHVLSPDGGGYQELLYNYSTGASWTTPYQAGNGDVSIPLNSGQWIGMYHYDYLDGRFTQAVYRTSTPL